MSNYEYLLSDINKINGVGIKTAKLFKKKNINTVFDLLWSLPRDFIDRGDLRKINELQVGKIQTISIKVLKYNFPRIRNLPNRVICEDDTGKLECIFFNSYEGYIRKILPLNSNIIISGKIGFYKNRYQITNPTHISDNINSIKKIDTKYSLTEGLNEKKYNKIINEVLGNIPQLNEWLSEDICNKFNNITWKDAIIQLHDPRNVNKKGDFYDRLVFDEIFSNFLINSNIRNTIKKTKKNKKKFNSDTFNEIKNKIDFELTTDQNKAIKEINDDLKSEQKMFRLLQGDVGSGKTIVALSSILNVIESKFQTALMAPTEILAQQHYRLTKKIFPKNIRVEILTSKTDYKIRKKIINRLENHSIDLLIGTHSLFQEKLNYKK